MNTCYGWKASIQWLTVLVCVSVLSCAACIRYRQVVENFIAVEGIYSGSVPLCG